MKTLLVALAFLLFAGVSQADSVWTYSGNAVSGPDHAFLGPNPCACSIDGTVTFGADGSALAWSFTDGSHTLTNLNSTGRFFDTGTIKHGPAFSEWFVDLTGAGIYMFTEFYGSNYEATDGVLVGGTSLWLSEEGNKGMWSVVATPEPSTLLLLGAGLVGLLARQRMKTKRTQVSGAVWEPLG